jgi:putative endonuclease
MTFKVYILQSESTLKYYSGHTQNIENRLSEHNKGETSSIRHGIPWKLVWESEAANRSQAMRLEKRIKARGAKRFLEDLQKTG